MNPQPIRIVPECGNLAIYTSVSNWLDRVIDQLATNGAGFFDGITRGINVILDALEMVLVDTPWPVTAVVIAFFGTGKPPGILATIIFGLPPVVRLTALGIRQVPASIIEGAVAFGCNRRKLLLDVEIPLALPSIMAGVNQTILMCLSMVVIASLIGAEGLGSDVLMALQYAAKGQGLLAGLAILLCAMVIDRVVQGRFKQQGS